MKSKLSKSLSLILALVTAGILGLDCSEEGRLRPNQPPETVLMVDGSLQAVTHYRQILSWHGEDIDGEVQRFEYKWTLQEGVDPGDFPVDWVGLVEPFVTQTKDTFFLPVPTAGIDTLVHSFQIRSVDNEGAPDPTPASASIRVFNQAPRLFAVINGDTTSVLTLPETILPVLSIQFKVVDPDESVGDDEDSGFFIEEIRFWFEDPLDYRGVPGTDTLLTIYPEDFGELIGVEREIHMQAVDRGGAFSNTLSASTFVQDVEQARILIVDSAVEASAPNTNTVDPFWHDDLPSLFEQNEVFIHDFGNAGPLGRKEDLGIIFSLFEAVIWYNGTDGAPLVFANDPSPEISVAEDGLVGYIESGGKVLLCGYNMIGASRGAVSGGSFSPEFEFDMLRVDSLYVHDVNTPGDEQTSNWWVFGPKQIPGFPHVGTDTLGLAQGRILKGVDRMALNPSALLAGDIEELYSLSRHDSYPNSLFDGSVGVRRRHGSGGEVVLVTFPISMLEDNGNRLEQVEGFLQGFGVLD